MNCPFCGGSVIRPKNNKPKKFCSIRCWKKEDYRKRHPAFEEARACKNCHKNFTAIRRWQKFCSHRCGDRFRAIRYKGTQKYKDFTKKSWYKQQYGITIGEVEAQRLAQDGQCAICKRTPKKLVVDHDHATGIMRGLLCQTCNPRLEHFWKHRHAMAEYLKLPL